MNKKRLTNIDLLKILCIISVIIIHAQRFCHIYQGAKHLLPPVIEISQEKHVKLHQIKAVILQNTQGGVPAAEIIDPYGKPCLMELLEDSPEQVHVLEHQTFRDFQLDRFMRHIIRCKGRDHTVIDIVVPEIKS